MWSGFVLSGGEMIVLVVMAAITLTILAILRGE